MGLIWINLDSGNVNNNRFTSRVVEESQRLGSHEVSANTVNTFEINVENFMDAEDRE